MNKKARLILEDGSIFDGVVRGYHKSVAGEVVFATGMVGYEQSLTDPSYAGQILTFTYPLIGNWGVPPKTFWESEKIQVAAVIISDLATNPNHHLSTQTLNNWLISEKIPALVGIDTRSLTQKLRDKGVMLGKIVVNNNDIDFDDPNNRNLVAEVSLKKMVIHKPISNSSLITPPSPAGRHHSSLNIALLNCGAKRNIIRSLTRRGATVWELPWNYDPFSQRAGGVSRRDPDPTSLRFEEQSSATFTGGLARRSFVRRREGNWRQDPLLKIDGLVISNGPGNPKMAKASIAIIKKALDKKIPTFGICLGNQLLALAAGGNTYKLKFGHRAQNQPTIAVNSKRCYITTQNHGFTVDEKKLPDGFKRWFYNANDNTNEGLIHQKLPFFSVQFHPEATPGPTDTEWLFDYFLEKVAKRK